MKASRTDPFDGAQSMRGRLDRLRAATMFWPAILFLVVLAALIHRVPRDNLFAGELTLIFWMLGLLWPVFIVESVARCLFPPPGQTYRRVLGNALAVSLLPPLRMGSRGGDGAQLWLPILGWRNVDKHLRRTLEHFFSVPMIVFALAVLPLLLIEYGSWDYVHARPGLVLFLDISTSLIWLAFAIELILTLSVAENRLQQAWKHWLDLAVVLLPIFEFVIGFLMFSPVLRLFRLLRLEQLGRLGRLYWLRSLMGKLWRAVLLLNVFHRIRGDYRLRRIRSLEALIARQEEELGDLRRELEDLRSREVLETSVS
jgi:voltage-gated potassium channel